MGDEVRRSYVIAVPHLEDIPKNWRAWHPSIRKARSLSESLLNGWNDALLFRTLATLRTDVPVFDSVEDLRWRGPRPDFAEHCEQMKSAVLFDRITSAKYRVEDMDENLSCFTRPQ